MMPIAMTLGAVFHPILGKLAIFTPYLIFIMLFLTYSKLKFKDIKFTPMHYWLVTIQFLGALTIYGLLSPFYPLVAQGVMICILAPTATAAPVITGMLKGNVANVTAYSLISNLMVALSAPIIFSFIGINQNLPFIQSFSTILQPMFMLLLLPLLLTFLLRRYFPELIEKASSYSGFSFYLWSVALMIVTAKTVGFIENQSNGHYTTEIIIGVLALAVCISQFLIGRKIGKQYEETVAGGQSLGQKNTILAIWMAQTYLNPIASIGPGMYVLWQNLINSFQLSLENKGKTKRGDKTH